MKATLLSNANLYYKQMASATNESYVRTQRAINVARSLAEDFLDQHYDSLLGGLPVMKLPNDLINDQPVMARCYRMMARIQPPSITQACVEGVETIFNKTGNGDFESIDPFQWQEVISDLYEEISHDIESLSSRGFIMCPYIVVMCDGVSVDPNTFEPYLPFQTRYGVIRA